MSFFVSKSLEDKVSIEDILEKTNDNDKTVNKSIYKSVDYDNYPMALDYSENSQALEIMSFDLQKKSFILMLDKDDYHCFMENIKKENTANILIFDTVVESLVVTLKNIKNYEYVSNNLIKVCIVID